MISHQLFGRTGHQSGRVIFGGAALSGMSQDRSDRLLPLLRRAGVSDTAAVGRAVRDVLARPGPFPDTSSDTRLLAATLDAAPDPVPTTSEIEADAGADLMARI